MGVPPISLSKFLIWCCVFGLRNTIPSDLVESDEFGIANLGAKVDGDR